MAGRRPLWPTLLVLLGTVAVVASALVLLTSPGSTPTGGAPTPSGTSSGGEESNQPSPGISAQPTPSPTRAPGGSPTPGSDATVPAVPVVPAVTVDVLNQTTQAGLASRAAAVIEQSGWAVGRIDNAEVAAPATTLYVPPGLEPAAATFVQTFPMVTRTRTAFEGLDPARLSLVLAAPDAALVVTRLEDAAPTPAPTPAVP